MVPLKSKQIRIFQPLNKPTALQNGFLRIMGIGSPSLRKPAIQNLEISTTGLLTLLFLGPLQSFRIVAIIMEPRSPMSIALSPVPASPCLRQRPLPVFQGPFYACPMCRYRCSLPATLSSVTSSAFVLSLVTCHLRSAVRSSVVKR